MFLTFKTLHIFHIKSTIQQLYFSNGAGKILNFMKKNGMFRNMVDTFLICSRLSKLNNHAENAEI